MREKLKRLWYKNGSGKAVQGKARSRQSQARSLQGKAKQRKTRLKQTQCVEKRRAWAARVNGKVEVKMKSRLM